jgi:hypothetical protein
MHVGLQERSLQVMHDQLTNEFGQLTRPAIPASLQLKTGAWRQAMVNEFYGSDEKTHQQFQAWRKANVDGFHMT